MINESDAFLRFLNLGVVALGFIAGASTNFIAIDLLWLTLAINAFCMLGVYTLYKQHQVYMKKREQSVK